MGVALIWKWLGRGRYHTRSMAIIGHVQYTLIFLLKWQDNPPFKAQLAELCHLCVALWLLIAKMVLLLVHISCIQVVFMHPIVTKQLIAPTVAAEGEKAPCLGLNEAGCSFSCAYTCICIFLRLSLDWSLTVAGSPERKIKSRNSRCECGRTCPRKQIQEEERWKVLSAQQLVMRKVLRVGQRSLPVWNISHRR